MLPSRSLVLHDLPKEVTDKQIRSFLESQGFEIAQIDIRRESVLSAIVTFANQLAAIRAKDRLRGVSFPGSSVPITPRWAPNPNTLWVTELGPTVTTARLRQGFQLFGPVEQAIVVIDPNTGKSKGYGFVVFSTVEGFQQAMASRELLILDRSTKPVRYEPARAEDDDVGFLLTDLPAAHLQKLAGMAPPHMAQPGTLEFEFALRWREQENLNKAQREALLQRHRKDIEELAEYQAALHKYQLEHYQASLPPPGPMGAPVPVPPSGASADQLMAEITRLLGPPVVAPQPPPVMAPPPVVPLPMPPQPQGQQPPPIPKELLDELLLAAGRGVPLDQALAAAKVDPQTALALLAALPGFPMR
ncbi:putative paraspeckle component 1 [Paratrimastix pyriformis]|uniref:Paraspeckle component 1 n=1 Tax=Paratrimastix pyriformis TaxID=342808 RepID=A0ABQ8UVP8_9EUKA|nr:putative paraspeckle component 1 [Paratrimastix pyriformis]